MLNKLKIIVVFLVLICGIYFIQDGCGEYECRKEGDTLKDIPLDDLYFGNYVSFYIDDYVKKEVTSVSGTEYTGISQLYTEGDEVYAVYTVLGAENNYIQVMVKDATTLNKLKYRDGEPVYFEGYVVNEPVQINKEWYIGLEENIYPDFDTIISNVVIQQTDIPPVGNSIYIGIFLVLLAISGYIWVGGIKSRLPKSNVSIYENNMIYYSHNIKNEFEIEKEKLTKLLAEQTQIKKTYMIWIFFLVLSVWVFAKFWFVFKMFAIIPLIVAIIGFWTCFINSGNEIAVYIARKINRRSVYLEIIECKRNLLKLEKAIDKLSINNTDTINYE